MHELSFECRVEADSADVGPALATPISTTHLEVLVLSLSSPDPEIQSILELARDLAERAGAIQRERYETDFGIDTKSATIDLVTEVDRACEALIVEGIQTARPGDAILAEEGHGVDDEGAGWRWIIDPLDGTTNFAHGFPRFCVSIGVESQGVRTLAVVYDPLLDERFEGRDRVPAPHPQHVGLGEQPTAIVLGRFLQTALNNLSEPLRDVRICPTHARHRRVYVLACDRDR